MHRIVRRTLPAVALLVASAAGLEAQVTAYGLTTNAQGAQQLVRLNPSVPGSVTTLGATGVSLTGIDFRPATNELYGYDGDKLYKLNLGTGVATLAFDVGNTAGARVGFDFNPTVDRIRLVGMSGSNFRLNPLDGSTTVDGGYTYAMGDVNFGKAAAFTAVAYTNSDTDPATGTMLYAIDPTLGQLVLVSSPNGGNINTVGSLGIAGLSSIGGFDIVTIGGVNTAYFTAMTTGSMTSQLYTVNLGTGAASLVGNIDAMNGVQGLALSTVPEPGTWALMITGLAMLGGIARRRKSA